VLAEPRVHEYSSAAVAGADSGGAPSNGDLWLLAPVATQPKRIEDRPPGLSRSPRTGDQQPLSSARALNKRPARRGVLKSLSFLNGF
jgi:hypothetical protein